jgi:hypothetical protein
MELQERLKIAKAAGPEYSELSSMFEAAITQDVETLAQLRKHASAAVRFATYVNPLTRISSSDLSSDPLVMFAAIHNPLTSTEILDEIGLSQSLVNPVIPEVIHAHKNASQEFQAFRAISGSEIDEDRYQDESEIYFLESVYDKDDEVLRNIDLVSLQALLYLYLLGHLDAPDPTAEFWDYLYDSEPKNLHDNLKLFGHMPAVPEDLYDECSTIVGARCLAGALTKDIFLMQSLMWDKQTLYTGVGGFYWQDSRSPRSSVASNTGASPEMLRQLFDEEKNDHEGLGEFPMPVLWRLSYNPKSPQDVLEGIVELIETEIVRDEYAQLELLVGEPEDFPQGLVTNPSVKGGLRKRLETLMKARDLDPDDYGDES